MIPKWDQRFLDLAKFYSQWSKDPSTKVGAVITRGKRQISQGYNGFAQNTPDTDYLYEDRDYKYATIIHGEENAIFFAKQDLDGCTLYTYPFIPCSNCAASVIQVGITRVVSYEPSEEKLQRWKRSFELSRNLFHRGKVELIEYSV